MSAQKIDKYNFIDAMRGLAVLLVIMQHALRNIETHGAMGSNRPLLGLLHEIVLNSSGVQLFFVISALTLCLSARGRVSEPNAHTNFFIRRVFRIAPMAYVAFFVYALLPAMRGKMTLDPSEAVATLVFVNGWNPTWISHSLIPGGWSIAAEMMFYVLFPALVLIVTNQRKAVIAIGVCMAIALLGEEWLLASTPPEHLPMMKWFAYCWLPSQMPVFLMGFLLFFILFGAQAARIEKVFSNQRNCMLLAVVCTTGLLGTSFLPEAIKHHWIQSVFFMGLITLAKFAYKPVLTHAFLRFAGKISFSAYLVHFYVLSVVAIGLNVLGLNRLPANVYYVLLVAVGVAITFAISAFTYKYIETPGQNLGKKLIERLRPRQPLAPSEIL
ncbi:acyltransferase family protein [Duganella aceris]|uniref:Acyltransferase n=1 Tax=Duganella aceris TaxID=2703883 RepID=A0ABX0FTM7_9BURK|nr:acyltransferase [Duganella aceris]NGZ88046.1 acyltransferase [Duganella aceris]